MPELRSTIFTLRIIVQSNVNLTMLIKEPSLKIKTPFIGRPRGQKVGLPSLEIEWPKAISQVIKNTPIKQLILSFIRFHLERTKVQ
jgi:hypothetical protein